MLLHFTPSSGLQYKAISWEDPLGQKQGAENTQFIFFSFAFILNRTYKSAQRPLYYVLLYLINATNDVYTSLRLNTIHEYLSIDWNNAFD